MTIPGLKIELESDVPVYRQIVDGVRAAAIEGQIEPGHRLPPTRDLARTLGVNRNTVVAAYETLADEGWVRSHTGKGTFLVSHPGAAVEPEDGGQEADPWFNAFSRTAEGAAAGGRQAHRVGAAVGCRALALQQAAGNHPADHVGQGGAVDAGLLDEIRLAQALIPLDGDEHRELTGRQAARADFLGEEILRELGGAAQEVSGGLVEINFLSH